MQTETGTKSFSLIPVCAFLVDDDADRLISQFYHSEIEKFGKPIESGIKAIHMSDFILYMKKI